MAVLRPNFALLPHLPSVALLVDHPSSLVEYQSTYKLILFIYQLDTASSIFQPTCVMLPARARALFLSLIASTSLVYHYIHFNARSTLDSPPLYRRDALGTLVDFQPHDSIIPNQLYE